MVQDHQNGPDASVGFDPLIQTDKIAYDSSQLVECPSCGRRNPPNRLGCVYCGSTLEIESIDISAIKHGFRRPDPSEPGFTVVSVPHSITGHVDISTASKLLSLEPPELQTILKVSVPMPLARVESQAVADSVQKILRELGVESTIIDDRSLAVDKPPVRLADISFSDSELLMVTFNSREQRSVPYDEIALMVEGVLSVSKVDQIEKRSRGGAAQMQSEVSTIFDEPILDIYPSKDEVGFRVLTSGFDFSGLGGEKRLIAAENLKVLIKRLAEVCPNSRTVNEFRSMRGSIGRVWDVEVRRDTKGLQVTGFGRRGFGSVLSASNLDQFTKFSRLQRLLL